MNGLCLSGGGIKAAAHIGALKALEEKNIKFDCVAGTSSGSIIAMLYALGYSSDEMYKLFLKYSKKIKNVELINILKLIWGVLTKGKITINGLNSGKIIEKIIKEVCKENNIYNINQIKVPILIPMVDLQTGMTLFATSKEIRNGYSDDIKFISNMPIEKAIRASCSYPIAISPCNYNGRQLVDGGIRENLPWKGLKQIGAEEILGICFETNNVEENCCNNMIETAIRSIELVCHELSNYEKEGIDKLVKIPTKKISLLDTKMIDELYKIGYKTMTECIKREAI